jgi:hypothetical protein
MSNRRVKALKEQNGELRARIGLIVPQSLASWETFMPQPMRDAFAARALICEEGNQFNALIRLGFPVGVEFKTHREHEEALELAKKVFGTPGVHEILDRDLSHIDDYRGAILERQAQIALYGADADSVKAATHLARTCGWLKSQDVFIQRNQTNILALVTQKNSKGQLPAEIQQALPTAEGFLSHEPGAPRRIDSGDLVTAAFADDE